MPGSGTTRSVQAPFQPRWPMLRDALRSVTARPLSRCCPTAGTQTGNWRWLGLAPDYQGDAAAGRGGVLFPSEPRAGQAQMGGGSCV